MDSCLIRASHGVGTARSATDNYLLPERDMALLLRQKDVLLREMQHRMGNSLQILASILLQKARTSSQSTTGPPTRPMPKIRFDWYHTKTLSRSRPRVLG